MYIKPASLKKMNTTVKGSDMYLGYLLFTENVPKQNDNDNVEENKSFYSLSSEEKNNWNAMASGINKKGNKKYQTKANRKPNQDFEQKSMCNRWMDDM